MKTFEIGPGLRCDPDRLVASRLLIQANSGGGKTRTLRRLLEQSHGRLQHLVIDPEGEYHTLREKFDYVLAAPSGGDTVAHPRTAAMLIEAYPKKMAREDVAARAGYTNLRSPGFANNISRLRTLGFVDYPDTQSVVARPVLFLEGR